MTNQRRRFNRGFTLVELLVVIGIIGALVGLLLPVLNKARQAAYTTACAANLHQFGIGLQMYCDGNKGLIPQKGPDGSVPAETFGPVNGIVGFDDFSLWFNAIPYATSGKTYYNLLVDDLHGSPAPTVGYNSLFICPAANAPSTLSTGAAPDQLSGDGMYFLLQGSDSQGVVPGPFKFNASYVINASLTNTFANTQSFTTIKLARLRPASCVVVIMEKLVNPGEYLDGDVQRFIAANPSLWTGLANTTGFTSNIGQPKANWKRFTTRHNGGGNILFADGHVGYFKWRETQVQPDQLQYVAANTYDLNQPGKLIWSMAGPIH